MEMSGKGHVLYNENYHSVDKYTSLIMDACQIVSICREMPNIKLVWSRSVPISTKFHPNFFVGGAGIRISWRSGV
ncbi:hypothetical protein BX600DRAFT_90506 [Xylariales sp. PMI_506]|nr:hypothetical protein BX600DRAFT_90506 [Xylariales sp. PMI_506]